MAISSTRDVTLLTFAVVAVAVGALHTNCETSTLMNRFGMEASVIYCQLIVFQLLYHAITIKDTAQQYLDNTGSSSACAFAMAAMPEAITSSMAAPISASMTSAIPENFIFCLFVSLT